MRENLRLTTREQQRSEVVSRWLAGIVTTAEAVALLGTSERTAWRLRAAMLDRGAEGIAHGNRGRASPRRLADGDRARILELARTEYRGYNDTHLAEALAEDEGIAISRAALRRLLRGEGVASPRRRRAPRYRSRRERMAQAGLLVQVDGSRHDWLEGRGPWLTLVGGIDDATGILVGAVFREQEDGTGYLTMLRDMARRHGLPAALYRDGSSVFAPTAPGATGRDEATQVGRALAELGIATILAGSAQAKGRIERAWGTLQDRLVSELRRAGAADLPAANAVLRAFLPRFNRRFAVPPASDVPAWRPIPAGSRPREGLRLPLAAGRRLRQLHPARGDGAPAPAGAGRPVPRRTPGGGRAAARRPAARRCGWPSPRRRRGTAGAGPAARPAGPHARRPAARADEPQRGLSSSCGPSVEAPPPRPARGATDRFTEQMNCQSH